MDQLTVEKVLPFAETLGFKRGEKVIAKGDPSEQFYYVQKGSIEVSYLEKGVKITVALLGEENFLGEIGFFDKSERVRNIESKEDTELKVFSETTIKEIKSESPELYGNFMGLLARSICKKYRRILDDREPVVTYGASLSVKGRRYEESLSLPDALLKTPEWKVIIKTVEGFKARFFEFSNSVQLLHDADIPEEIQRKCNEIMDDFNEQLHLFKELGEKSKTEEHVWGYLFKEIFPYIMRSRFAERSYYKPKGIAGDFGMIEMIYQNRPEGDGKIGKLIDSWFINAKGPRAVRGRRKFLRDTLHQFTGELAGSQSGKIRIMNLACGSSRELFDFLSECRYSERIEAILMDIDPDAFKFISQKVNVFFHSASILLMKENLVKWSLKRVNQDFDQQDVIYSAGITDYFNEKLFCAFISRCYDYLKPGGRLVIGNFSPFANRLFMDHILNWPLIYRDKGELVDLFFKTPFKDNIEVKSEEEGVNLFAIAHKR